ncbi:MAG: MlaD family protein [Desulfobulbaceae bacterium]|nr:MlaD family protein [Desulfobulbaceae bacterium]
MESPVIKKGGGLSPIWVLPLVALCIAGWLLYASYRDAGITCTIHFENAEGITAGKTQVMYKGVAVGIVEQITVDEDLQGVNLTVKVEKKARRGLVSDTKFWIVRPRISAGRVSGLETILSGSYIAVQPGSSTEFATRFEGLPEAPTLPPDSPGLHITLMSDALYSLQKDSPVYTRNLKIGKVLDYYLGEDRSVLIDLYIEPEFSHLIQMGTRFWNSSGFSFEGNLQSGFSLKLESLAALVYGGISCGTPEPLADTSPPALSGMVYKLYPDYESAEYWLPMTLQLASGEGITEGKTKVMFRGIEAGIVRKIRVNNDENLSVTAEILLDPRAESILKKGTRFWVVRPEVSLTGINQIDTLISGPYITFVPGQGVFKDNFIVEKEAMPRQVLRNGKHFTLIAEDNGFVEAGSPVLFNRMKVGEVYEIRFGKDQQTVHTDILIYDKYTQLVKENSVFWNSSGIKFDAGFSGVRLNVGTVESLLRGGISFTTPKAGDKPVAEPAAEGSSFNLFSSLAEATRSIRGLHPPGLVFQLQSTADLHYEVGSPVLYRKVPVGEVIGHRLSDDLRNVLFDILVYEKYTGLINGSTLFYNSSGFSVDAGLRGIAIQADSVASILSGGISFVTPETGDSVGAGHNFTLHADYTSALQHDRVTITLRLNRAEGVGNNTAIKYQGMEIGSIRDVRFGPEMKEVVATATVRKEAASLFREKSRLELIRPSIDFTGVRHIATILTGPFINLVPGEGELCSDFILYPDSAEAHGSRGLNIILETPRLGFLNIGNPVYYRQVQVGQVTGYNLSATAQKVLVRVNIYPGYAKLVYSGTKFWLASGMNASWGLFSGLQLDAESLEALIVGGISFATPESEEMGEPARNGDHFQLHDQKDAQWTAWAPELEIFPRESQVDKHGDSQ